MNKTAEAIAILNATYYTRANTFALGQAVGILIAWGETEVAREIEVAAGVVNFWKKSSDEALEAAPDTDEDPFISALSFENPFRADLDKAEARQRAAHEAVRAIIAAAKAEVGLSALADYAESQVRA